MGLCNNSTYPETRVEKDLSGKDIGRMGKVEMLNFVKVLRFGSII